MSSGTHKRARLSPDPAVRSNKTPPALYPVQTAFAAPSAPSAKHKSNPSAASANNSSSFRNVSACNRCRIRKNRCDQNLPACTSCEKAGVRCVGFDPITKREIPRTYVYFLESRVHYLEELLSANSIQFTPASKDFDLGSTPVVDPAAGLSPPSEASHQSTSNTRPSRARSFNINDAASTAGSEWEQKEESDKLNKLVSNIGMVSVQGASDPRFLGSTSGISFARVVFAAIKSSVNEKNGGQGSRAGSISSGAAATSGTSMRDSFFGLSSKPNIKPAPFPDRTIGMKLVNLYFEYANPQIPILHRGEFMGLFARAYATKDRQRSPRELYLLNIVFAVGAAIILPDSSAKNTPNPEAHAGGTFKQEPDAVKGKPSSMQRQPEEYHASAMMHLESFLGSMPASDRPEGFGGGLEQLQAVLLLAGFALLRPVAPGLWYIVGVAVRLGVDLGLHFEDKATEDTSMSGAVEQTYSESTKRASIKTERYDGSKEQGRRDWMRDLRRRLWWCVYSFDRLVSTCVGRPFGVTDQVITTQWYSVLDDKDITPDGFLVDPNTFTGPSYKRVGHHYLRLRLLQSEILQVLQHRQAQKAHRKAEHIKNPYMHTKLSCPFLQPFDGSFHAWRSDLDRRLWEWKESAPLTSDTTVQFNIKFLELNYWQAVIVLYRQSLSVPENFASETGPHNEVESPLSPNADDFEDEEEIFLKVAEAGQTVLKLYLQLHQVHLVNYTYLATVHIFMAGISFLYSIWHSPIVRARLAMEDVKFTVRAGTLVLNDLVEKCPPAEACRDAFDRMSQATIKMCRKSTGFGSQVAFGKMAADEVAASNQPFDKSSSQPSRVSMSGPAAWRPRPSFDYNLRDLFSEPMSDNGYGSMTGDNSGALGSQWSAQASKALSSGQYPYPSPASTVISLPNSNSQHQQSSQPPLFREPSYQTQSVTSNPDSVDSQQQQYGNQPLNPVITSTSPPPGTASSPYDPSTSTQSDPSNNSLNMNNNSNSLFPPSAPEFSFDFLLTNDPSPLPPTYHSASAGGLNLGFDGRHDWADGNTTSGQGLPDLFGDFFFGNGGTYAGPLGEVMQDYGMGMEGLEGMTGVEGVGVNNGEGDGAGQGNRWAGVGAGS